MPDSTPDVKSDVELAPVPDTSLPGRTFSVAGVDLILTSDDPGLGDEFARVFGGTEVVPFEARPCLTALVTAAASEWGDLVIGGDDLRDPASFLLGFSSPTVPMKELPPLEDGARVLTIEGSGTPLFVFYPDRCVFRKVPRWRRIVAHVLFLRLIRLRPEYRFFHAASLAVAGSGLMLIGPKGTGKSTLSLALAIRGHALYGDETAIFDPKSKAILPMCRPVGIKPGPRSAAVEASLRALTSTPDEDGMVRVPAHLLVPVIGRESVPLRDVIFLNGFDDAPRIEPITPGRDELSAMQPLRSSEPVAASTLQVFELIRLLGSVHCYRLAAGNPDATADLIEETLRTCH